jgi:hypothetical protein
VCVVQAQVLGLGVAFAQNPTKPELVQSKPRAVSTRLRRRRGGGCGRPAAASVADHRRERRGGCWLILFGVFYFQLLCICFTGTHSKALQRVCKDLDCKKSESACWNGKGRWERFVPSVNVYSLSPAICWFPCHVISSSSAKQLTPVGSTKFSTEIRSLLEAALAFDLIRAE